MSDIQIEQIQPNLKTQLTLNDLPIDLIREKILSIAPQLGLTCKEYHKLLPNIDKKYKRYIMYPSNNNRTPLYIKHGNTMFEYECAINFENLNKLIENHDVQCLKLSTVHPIFLEIKKNFELILKNDFSIINNWKYKDTFLTVYKNHYDSLGNKKLVYVQMEWINSFITTFIMYLYH